MEAFPQNTPRSPERVPVPIELHYSTESEIARVQYTAAKYAWYKKKGYNNVRLPQGINECLERGEEVTDVDIRAAIEAEYQNEAYAAKALEISTAWESESADFIEKLKTLGRPLPDAYEIFLTTYGTGGSYVPPNVILLNIRNNRHRNPLYTPFHEMVHLAIEDLIEKYGIPHSTKERIVDLTMNKFIDDEKQLQEEPDHAEHIATIFEETFPDIEKIIEKVSTISRA